MRDLNDAGPHELQRVAGAGLDAKHHRIGKARHVGLGLADAHGLDQHAIEQGAHQHHGGQGLVGESAQPIARRHRAHEDAAIRGVVHDAHAVAQKSTAAGFGRGVDGNHADPQTVPAPGRQQRGAKRGFADARWAGDAQYKGLGGAPGLAQQGKWRIAVAVAFEIDQRRRQRALAAVTQRLQRHSVLSGPPSAACAADSRAIGTR